MYDLVIYDTSNFVDFPIGGQLTSIRNFLKFIAIQKKEISNKILLVGISSNPSEIGKKNKIFIDGIYFDFIPILYREGDLKNIKSSLRLEYLKAILKSKNIINIKKTCVHYIHTPEAFIPLKLLYPFSKIIVFSHGNFFNMIKGFRFYKDNKFIKLLFNIFLIILLKKADLIFTLDEESMNKYKKFTKKLIPVDNSIILPPKNNLINFETQINRLLFVGRLSKVKNIYPIIEAVKILNNKFTLTIVGDGEEYNNIKNLIMVENISDIIKLEGAVHPDKIKNYMLDSDILIMNSILEGKPMTILEAMSYGLPVVTTPVGGIREITIEGENSEYTNGTSLDICNAIKKISKNYNYYKENAYIHSKKFDYKIINEKIFREIYKVIEII